MSAKKKSKKKTIIIVAVIVVVVGLIIFLAVKAVSGVKKIATTMNSFVDVVDIDYQDLSETITLTGSVEGISSTNVTSKAAAEVSSVSVSVGDRVNEGDILCMLDSSEIEKQIEETQTLIQNQNALSDISSQQNQQALSDAKEDQESQLKQAQEEINEAVSEYNKANAALNSDKDKLNQKKQELTNAQNDYNAAKSALDAAQTDNIDELAALQAAYENTYEAYTAVSAEVSALQAQVDSEETAVQQYAKAVTSANNAYASMKTSTERSVASAQTAIDMEKYQTSDSSAQSTLKSLQEQLEDCTVYAPCSGVVTAVNISVGDNNTPGAVLITIEDTSTMKITATVDESDILKIEEGMEAVVTATALGNEQMEGTVSRVVRVKSASGLESGGSGYAAEITIQNSDLLVGMSAKAKVMLQKKDQVLCVPYDLIFSDDDGQKYVLLAVDRNDGTGMSTAVRCNVETGEESDYYTEIVGGDLKSGDKIVADTTIQEGDMFFPGSYWDMMEEAE